MYGVTEVSCWATIASVDLQAEDLNEQEINLGRPLRNTLLRVVNDLGDEIAEGEGKKVYYLVDILFALSCLDNSARLCLKCKMLTVHLKLN